MPPATIGAPLAFAAGLLSFLSPCVLPLVPGFLAVVAGLVLAGAQGLRDDPPIAGMAAPVLFVAGFSLVFISLGAVATPAGAAVAHALPWIERIGGICVALLGVVLLVIAPLGVPTRLVVGLVAGLGFGAGWTPCVGPVLASILAGAGDVPTSRHGLLLLATYAAGLAVPFLVLALLFQRVTAAHVITRRSRPLQLGNGAMLVLIGALLATGRFRSFTGMLAGLGQLVTLRS